MPLPSPRPAAGPRPRRRTSKTTASSPGRAPLRLRLPFLLASLAALASPPRLLPLAVVRGEPAPTIPRSNNRYTLSDGTVHHDDTYQPPWNPSPRIDPAGFLSESYLRAPGEWEPAAALRGRHGPRDRRRYALLSTVPCRVRQVPGDGNCLFHAVAVGLHRAANGTHMVLDAPDRLRELRGRSLALRRAAVDALRDEAGGGRRRLFLQGGEWLEARELLAAAAAQFGLGGEEYCRLMGRESYWGGGPEIVALCNHLRRPIHM